jgi:hypothetical protein
MDHEMVMTPVSHKYFMEHRIPVERYDPPRNLLHPKDWSSIYISCLPENFANNREDLSYLIEHVLYLGSIQFIDYITDEMGRSDALVHFQYWIDNEDVKQFRYYMENMDHLDLYGLQIIYTTPLAADNYNYGKPEKYVALTNYFRELPPSTFLRMKIHKMN